MSEDSRLSPMFRQYHALKQKHANAILLYRMGDFYEMFHEDARVASRLLELTLTARGKGTANVVPMCGFPHHQLENYTARLVRADQRVAICDQVEDPKKTKGLVRREVVRMVTPGTITDPAQLESKQNIWLAAVATATGRLGAAFIDLSTGEFLAWETVAPEGERWHELGAQLRTFGAREIVCAEDFAWPDSFRAELGGRVLTESDPYPFAPGAAEALLTRHFEVASLDGLGFKDRPAAVAAAGGLLQYLEETQKSGLEHVDGLRLHEPSSFLRLDPATLRNLELDRSLRDGGRRGSLLDAVDETITPAGGRLLRSWLLSPLLDVATVNARQECVEELLQRSDLRRKIREELKGVLDIERLVGRSVAGGANARELMNLRTSLERVPGLIATLGEINAALLRSTLDGLDPCQDVAQRLSEALVDDPPATLRDGGVIRDGFSDKLDQHRTILRDGKSTIASIEAREREATGISSLKVRYNKVFGYFIEVSKANLGLVPESYQRKQTISTGERYLTPELKEHESRVLHAQENIESLELDLFNELRSEVARQASRLKAVAAATARIDVLEAFAELADLRDYTRPTVHSGPGLRIVGGRHPVVEQSLIDRRFVPNDTSITSGGKAIAVLTGPNMGGKSTYLRQLALIVLLAQSGCFVPASEAEIGIVDRIFCRVGASDSLAEGQSTFMVEMTETANILNHATPLSLLLLDEVGRGTSTFDGLSIAWAVVEHLHARQGGAPRTLFATHYHELTELAVELDGVINLRMAVREWDDGVVFMHRVEEGAADRSYGIQVARLAGVPVAVVRRAKEILTNLERDEYGRDGLPRRARRGEGDGSTRRGSQPSLFAEAEPEPSPAIPDDTASSEVLADLRGRDLNGLTPLEALNLLADWKRRLDED